MSKKSIILISIILLVIVLLSLSFLFIQEYESPTQKTEEMGSELATKKPAHVILESLFDREVWNKEADIYEFGVGWVGAIRPINDTDSIFNDLSLVQTYNLENDWELEVWKRKEYRSYAGNYVIIVNTKEEMIPIALNRDRKDTFLCLIKQELMSDEIVSLCELGSPY